LWGDRGCGVEEGGQGGIEEGVRCIDEGLR
jgi:hypothetical protein